MPFRIVHLQTDNTSPAWYPNLNWGNPISCDQAISSPVLTSSDWFFYLLTDKNIAIRWEVLSINWSEYYRSENEQILGRPELIMDRFHNNE